MNVDKAIEFIVKHKRFKFYQPVIFQPGVVEIRGKWHEATIELADVILEGIAGKRIVDVGCHCGYFLHEGMRRGARFAHGYEVDPFVYDMALEISEILEDGVEISNQNLAETDLHIECDVVLIMNLPKPHEIHKILTNVIYKSAFLQVPTSFRMDECVEMHCERAFGRTKLLKISAL